MICDEVVEVVETREEEVVCLRLVESDHLVEVEYS